MLPPRGVGTGAGPPAARRRDVHRAASEAVCFRKLSLATRINLIRQLQELSKNML